jgi:formylglycine-generating enzyme required for sulfatase activity
MLIGHKKIRIILIFLYCSITFNDAYTHGVVVSNVAITGQNTLEHYTHIHFDISWNNSWRTPIGPSNWDACWVFVKYRKKDETTWNHATLNTSGHSVPDNGTIDTPADGKGVFIYSADDMIQGSVTYSGVKLRWNYGIDGLDDDDLVEVAVSAIEMVYVPQGSFYVGCGTNTEVYGNFRRQDANVPFNILSENEIILGGSNPSSLNNGANFHIFANAKDDFGNSESKILPAGFPKGYDAFYSMKYEITQEQYVSFLNTLTREQQNARTTTDLSAGITEVVNRYVINNASEVLYRNSICCDAVIHPTNPVYFYCDLNANGIGNEEDDGQNIAQSLDWGDLAAYLDWAALRPMTELEFEKAARGPLVPVPNEYAWGNTTRVPGEGFINSGRFDEVPSNSSANCASFFDWDFFGLTRVGSFGQGVNTRQATGASYYGIMELSGNLWERVVSVSKPEGRAFTGLHGNGVINFYGDADVEFWPIMSSSPNGLGSGMRGGSYSNQFNLRVSCRYGRAAGNAIARDSSLGGRGVRSAP